MGETRRQLFSPVRKYQIFLNLLIIFEMKAYTIILTGCLMAISCDPGQVIDLCDLDVVSCECTDDKYCIKVEQTDMTTFQLSLSESTGTNLLTTNESTFNNACGVDWTCGADWSIASNRAVHSGFAIGAIDLDLGATLTNNTYYKLEFTLAVTGAGTVLGVTLGGTSNTVLAANGTTAYTETRYIFIGTKSDNLLSFSSILGDFYIEDVVLTKMSYPDVVIKNQETGATAFDFTLNTVTVVSRTYPLFIQYTLEDAASGCEIVLIGAEAQITLNWGNLGISAGCYTIVIEDEETAEELESRCIALQTNHVCSLELSFTNSVNAFGLNFEDFTFTQYLRIDARRRNPRYQYNEKIFTDGSGSHTLTYARKTKIFSFDTEPLPRDLLTAINCGLLMDDFQIDGVRHVREISEISPSWNKNYALAPLAMEIKEASQPNQVNRLC